MALRGKKPTTIQKRFKGLFFGPAGSGKTTCCLQFPRPYLIDTERGAENDNYVKLLDQAGGAYYFTTDFDDMLNEIRSLLSEKHEYRTVIIDPLTVPYNDLLDKTAQSMATREDPAGTAFGRHKGPADRKVKHLLTLLLRLDMNVLITSHAKTKWEKAGREVIDAGQTFDCYGKLDYLFDLVFEIQRRGDKRMAIVRKTRNDGFPENDNFEFSFAEVAKRYGRDILERAAEVVTLASREQVVELGRLVQLLQIPSTTIAKWLEKAQAESFAEMSQDIAAKTISYLRNQVSNGEAMKVDESETQLAEV